MRSIPDSDPDFIKVRGPSVCDGAARCEMRLAWRSGEELVLSFDDAATNRMVQAFAIHMKTGG